ncbi:hypothetical protein J2858_001586 [Neorhizobium galegae]|nr:hypothetical protein [Neorhizobium galegae]
MEKPGTCRAQTADKVNDIAGIGIDDVFAPSPRVRGEGWGEGP